MSNFDVIIEPTDGALLLRVQGELDIGTVPRFDGAVAEARARQAERAVVDMRGCTFIDSTGTRAIGVAGRQFSESGLELRVVCPSENKVVRTVLELLGLDQVVPIDDELPGHPGGGGSGDAPGHPGRG